MDEVFETVAAHAYKDDETSTIATDFVQDDKRVGCILPPKFNSLHVENDNPLPTYRKAAKILEKYKVENELERLGFPEESQNNPTNEASALFIQKEMLSTNMFNDEDIEVDEMSKNAIQVTDEFYDSFDQARCLSAQNTTKSPTNDGQDTHEVNLEISNKAYNLDGTLDDFIQSLSDRELLGYNEPFQSFEYHSRTCTCEVNACYAKANPLFLNAGKYQSYLGFRPIEVVRQTLMRTTQMAKLSSGIPMRRHFQSLFPFLNRKRIDETVATDTFFASTDDVSGAKCAQIFYGLISHFMNIYSLRTEADGPKAFEDFA
jgi:hypothetical protein